jgi:DNA-binding transcriptional LysR family regulator
VYTCKVATLLPQSYVRNDVLENNGLVMRQLEELEQTARTTSLIYSEASLLNESTRLLVEKAKQHFKKV